MTALRMGVMNTLEQVPEDKLETALNFMKKLVGGNEDTLEMKAYKEMHEILRRNNVHVSEDFDYKDEVAKAVLKKYASLG